MARQGHITGKALCVEQPWAWAIIEGLKDVENRTWPTHHRGPLLIHAGLKDDLDGWHFLDQHGFALPVDPPSGGIIGVVDVVDCVRDYPSIWAPKGCWHWLLENPQPLPFRPYTGGQRLFNVR
jgi:hypothetical protein